MTIRVSPERLQEQKGYCKTHALTTQTVHNQLNHAVHQTPHWTGDSQSAFEHLWNVWGTALNDLQTAFELLGAYLAEASLVYSSTDQHIATTIEKNH